MNQEIYEILINLGYKPKNSGFYWTMTALYRGGDNGGALSIHKDSGHFHDFVTGQSGSWNEFLKLNNINPKNIEFRASNIPQSDYLSLNQIKKYDKNLLNKLIPYYKFYEERGIDRSILEKFQCGMATSGKLINRLVFPIFDERENIIGFGARTLLPVTEKNAKWLIIGRKANFCYPLFLNKEIIRDKRTVILVESIGDVLALWNSGYQNCLCLFGTALLKGVLKNLIMLDPKKIILALNNDEENKNNAGQNASAKLYKQLRGYFDNIEKVVPTKNDWGDLNEQEIKGILK